MVTLRNKISPKIIEKLRSNKEKIISRREIFQVIREYQRIYHQRVNRGSIWTYLRKSHYIKRILKDYYYVYSLEERHHHYCRFSEEELVFTVLKKMNAKWYLGLNRALIENKIRWQILNIVPIINNHFSGIKRVGNSRFKFIRTKDEKFTFGLINKTTNNQVRYFYSDPEKTYLDFLYFYSYEGKDPGTVKKILDFNVSRDTMRKYAKHYPKRIQELL